ncbi:TrbI F-type domain-containing protein [Rosenbergiella collisarenosi]|uniref:TrbI F-type domain-containing protein n=1 Tax=Rosenbergiella collisarenosi TaxID=1544695 RepID=UPI001F4E3C2E|nr:TrbI F-type domain-containing protein [Rosenbergiella collisarenosi]
MNIKGFIKKYALMIISFLVFIITINVITTLVVIHHQKPKIVTFDIKQTTDDFVQQTAVLGQKINKQQLELMTKKFNASLDKTINQYSSEGYVVMVGPAVIAGAKNITPEVKMKIAQNMKAK